MNEADSTPKPVHKYQILWHHMTLITTKHYLPTYASVSQVAPSLYLPIYICEAPKSYNINVLET
jgi:hypothetical protein